MAKKIKFLGWVITSVLILFIAGLGFIYLTPGYSLKLVRSGSMTPAVRMGDVIINGPINGSIKPGMIVTYQRGDELITHRVVSVNNGKLVMQGDALEHPDPWLVTLSDVKGTYLFKIPFIGFALNFIRTKLGWFLAIIVPTVVLVGWLCRDILKEAFSDVEKTPKNNEADAHLRSVLKETRSESRKTSDKNIRDVLIKSLNEAYQGSIESEVNPISKQKKTR
ncbi:MAG: family signal peptidase [Dehalococcoidales bacterium]|nr:family signal peptidase [Dehalococcoidales bacterium]